jgi:hypothetical protein
MTPEDSFTQQSPITNHQLQHTLYDKISYIASPGRNSAVRTTSRFLFCRLNRSTAR